MILVRTVALTRTYRSGASDLVVFDSVDLEVEVGECLAIVGESGAGKSTLLYLVGALDRPTSGTIYFEDRDLSQLTDSQLA